MKDGGFTGFQGVFVLLFILIVGFGFVLPAVGADQVTEPQAGHGMVWECSGPSVVVLVENDEHVVGQICERVEE